jgi:hypothetical protein
MVRVFIVARVPVVDEVPAVAASFVRVVVMKAWGAGHRPCLARAAARRAASGAAEE